MTRPTANKSTVKKWLLTEDAPLVAFASLFSGKT